MEKELEDKMIDLESRLMYLEDNARQINLELMKKDQLLEVLYKKIDILEDRLKDLDERKMNRASGEGADERPPHY